MKRISSALTTSLLVGTFLATSAWALDGIALSGPESIEGPQAAELLATVQEERALLEKRIAELAERQGQLELAVVKSAEAALTACPPLTQIKYRVPRRGAP